MKNWNTEFYEQYAKHLTEPTVRQAHDKMFGLLRQIHQGPMYTVDYGCGTGEYLTYNYDSTIYYGIDKNKVNDELPHVIADFTTEDIFIPFDPTVFISVFASEIIQPAKERYDFYRHLFNLHPTLRTGMVAGVLYKGKEKLERVTEDSGFTIFQTVEPQHEYICDEFSEVRHYQKVESEMWGEVIEVWKFFTRNET